MRQRISRRRFLETMGLAAAAAVVAPRARAQGSGPFSSEPVDVMIIGSGFGGAVAARRLTAAGIPTVLLERGRRWPITPTQDTFSPLKQPDGRSAWLSDFALLGPPDPIDRHLGVMELVLGDGIAALAGAGFGGGSLVYAGALYQPPESLFNLSLGGVVSYQEMHETYYPRVRTEIAPAPITWRMLRRREYAGAQSWQQMGQRAGLATRLLDLGVDWQRVQGELDGSNVPSVIAGEFWYGNNSGAKRSLDQNYLQRAEQSGLLTVVTQANVSAIMEGPDGRYRVLVDDLNTDGTAVSTREFVVTRLFLAAGSLGTSRLLVRARGRGWLPALNAAVGQSWGNNGDFFSTISPFSGRVSSNLGGTVPVAIEDFDNPIMPTTVECYADWSLEGTTGAVASVGMAPVPAKGRFTYHAGRDDALLSWPATDPEITAVTRAGELTYRRLGLAWRGDLRVSPGVVSANAPVTAAVTAHPLGGVTLGAATDEIGTVHNYPGLYVIDGALIPGHTGCANPALTIAALAERNIERIVLRDFT